MALQRKTPVYDRNTTIRQIEQLGAAWNALKSGHGAIHTSRIHVERAIDLCLQEILAQGLDAGQTTKLFFALPVPLSKMP